MYLHPKQHNRLCAIEIHNKIYYGKHNSTMLYSTELYATLMIKYTT